MFGDNTNPGAVAQPEPESAQTIGHDNGEVASILKEAADLAQAESGEEQPDGDPGDEVFEGAAGEQDEAGTQADEGDEAGDDMPDEYAERWKKMEAAHTRRSQELADLRREAEADCARLREVIERLENRTPPSGDGQSGADLPVATFQRWRHDLGQHQRCDGQQLHDAGHRGRRQQCPLPRQRCQLSR